MEWRTAKFKAAQKLRAAGQPAQPGRGLPSVELPTLPPESMKLVCDAVDFARRRSLTIPDDGRPLRFGRVFTADEARAFHDLMRSPKPNSPEETSVNSPSNPAQAAPSRAAQPPQPAAPTEQRQLGVRARAWLAWKSQSELTRIALIASATLLPLSYLASTPSRRSRTVWLTSLIASQAARGRATRNFAGRLATRPTAGRDNAPSFLGGCLDAFA